jgi:hypothetical protein
MKIKVGDRHARRAKIYFNGTEIRSVIEADEEQGTIVRFVRDSAGRIMRDPDNEGDALKETLKGAVRIELPEEDKR